MDLTPNEDQVLIQNTTAAWCREHIPLEQARARLDSLWSDMVAMGWIGMTAPEMDFDHATETLVFAELGRHLAPIGVISSSVAASLPGQTQGDGKTALALVGKDGVRLIDSRGLDRALGLFDGRVGLIAIPPGLAAGLSLDPSATLAKLDDLPEVTAAANPRSALHLQLLAAAFAVGCADAARDMACEYAKLREQFGRPIGWFQVIKHMCADMAVRAAVARSQLYFAACALDAGDPATRFHISAAKRLADQAALENARTNIQIHGGIGMTDEASPHLCLKRAHLLSFIAPATTTALLGAAAAT